MKSCLAVLLAAVVLAGCGGSEPDSVVPLPDDYADSSEWPALELTPEPGFDPDDPAIDTIPDDDAHREELLRRAGDRRDFKVPASMVSGVEDGPLVLAVVTRPFNELGGDEAAERRLNAGQRAVYAIYLADFEILNGGFSQFWLNSSASISNGMTNAAERIGSPEFAAIHRDAQALWPGGEIPRDYARREELLTQLDGEKLAALDQRYAATQYKRATALGTVLGRYIRANTDEFVAS
jgi:hypothetical protein